MRPYLSDTDDDGNPTSVDLLDITVIGNEHENMVKTSLSGFRLSTNSVDDDVFGLVSIDLRASDGVKQSDTTLVVNINGVNDAPSFDGSIFKMKY